MEVEMGNKVVDQKGKLIGTVDYVIRDPWSGEIKKFAVFRKAPEKDLFIPVEDTAEITKSTVKLKVTVEELNQR